MRDMTFARRAGLGLLATLAFTAPLGLAPLAVPAARAQQAAAQPSPAVIAVARELVVANGEARAFEGVISEIVNGAARSFVPTNPDLAKPLSEVAQTLRTEFEKRQGEVVQILAAAYATRFSEAELKEALAFYKTATGKKLVTDRPAIVQQTVQGIQVWGAQVNAEVLERVRAEMKKRGYDL
ncbi:DUF2059 domain-containing protein [Xanthobacter tagetidis]|jgi:hypothetical protein|uniref:DUF2059 domain-containing protein n=1 Tax=Xanthobacter tagetidis TaxID=60216 RepID=A0A3L7A698_9HYPH|nr:DUF2059 domain-containing protein [Xanthobacter tagetidis]MBB6307303.1 hypothetical protein [Xanthobacter tagetidis]RLP75846.1 DUF2059 domain-containing protein [Xanthobacter tagetidis]